MTLKYLIENAYGCDVDYTKMHPDDVEESEKACTKMFLALKKKNILINKQVVTKLTDLGCTCDEITKGVQACQDKYAHRVGKWAHFAGMYTGIKSQEVLRVCEKYVSEYEYTEDDYFYTAMSIFKVIQDVEDEEITELIHKAQHPEGNDTENDDENDGE